jgi:ribosomal protein L14
MNIKTTLVLIVIVVAGGLSWFLFTNRERVGPASETLTLLEHEITPQTIHRIEIERGKDSLVLEKSGNDWSLPGKWQVRKAEVEELVRVLGTLRSRFIPERLDDPPDLKKYGLDHPLIVKVRAGNKEFKLALAEDPSASDRFTRSTNLRMNELPEVVRLAPGLIPLIDRPTEYFRQRRLFPVERVAKEPDSPQKVEQLAARAVHVQGKDGNYDLEHDASQWVIRLGKIRDRVEPDKLKEILTSLPDIWVERFVEPGKKTLDEMGLTKPEDVIQVTRTNGDKIKLFIGRISDSKIRLVQKPQPFGAKQPPQALVDEYRYAKLQDNDQAFEIKSDHLKKIIVAGKGLRDPQLARFRPEDANRIEITEGSRRLAFSKNKDDWRMKEPSDVAAERSKLTELLDKLSGLRAQDNDVIDLGDKKKFGLDKATKVTVTVETKKSGDGAKAGETKTFTFLLGKKDEAGKKVFVQMAGWERINAVDDAVAKLVERPALAYRSREILHFASDDLARIDIQRPSESFTLTKTKDTWQMTSPVRVDVDRGKADGLASDLGRLEAEEFVADKAAADVLEKEYGLAKPALTIKVGFKDAKKPAQTLLVGKRRPGKQDYLARLESDQSIFAIKKEVFETLDRESLAYRPLNLWNVEADKLAEVRIQKGDEFRLKKEGNSWKLAAPFDAPVLQGQVKDLTSQVADLKAERFVAHAAKDLATYGLARPYLRIALVTEAGEKKEGGEKKKEEAKAREDTRERVLLIGSVADQKTKTRYGRLGDGEAIFVVSDKVISAIDHAALDFLDPKLLALDTKDIQKIRVAGAGRPSFVLERTKDEWRVQSSAAPPFAPDLEILDDCLRVLSDLKGTKVAAYGPKVELKSFGLDKPAVTLSMVVKRADAKGKSTTAERTLALGSPVAGKKEERYARLDNGPAVVVLGADAIKRLDVSYLDFVNHAVWNLDPSKVTAIRRQRGTELTDLVKRNNAWRLARPDLAADDEIMSQFLSKLTDLRAARVADYPARDLKKFGLDRPLATVVLRLDDAKGKAVDHVLAIGALVDARDPGQCYARADKSDAVVVIPRTLVVDLLGDPIQFRDRNLARLTTPDRIIMERGLRKVTFSRMGDSWKVTEPVQADAENEDMESFVRALGKLRADELVADKAADLKKFGLDRPRVRWHFLIGTKETLTLYIGAGVAGKKDDPRVYARLATSDLVFLLDRDLSKKTLAEYRERKIWPPLDAVQIEKLTYRAAQPFSLEKVDNKWRLVGRPEARINETAVQDTLDALAGLKAERFVTDRAMDLQLFGLQPPVLTIEIDASGGKRILHIGRMEGGSQRYYARVADTALGPVFVMAEADARRVVRSAKGFLNGK